MNDNGRHIRDPWHVDVLIEFLQETLTALADDYHQKPNAKAFHQRITLLHDALDALTVQIPDIYQPALRQPHRHAHLHDKPLQNHVMQTERE